ncbi:hypothetical protein KXV92_007399 [Aspergillus fumigatus]|nr:hypothetical protein KXV92_007399 [Aspergillus fumigatus]
MSYTTTLSEKAPEEAVQPVSSTLSDYDADLSSSGYPESPDLEDREKYAGILADTKKTDKAAPGLGFIVWTAINVASTVAIVFTNKYILSDISFHNCQVAFAAYHFFITGATLWVVSRPQCAIFIPKQVSIMQISPLAAAMCIQVVLQNLSLAYSSVMFHQLARLLLTPVVALLNYMLYSTKIPRAAVSPLILLCSGVGIVSYYDSLAMDSASAASTSSRGTIFALAGVCTSAVYTVWIGQYHKKFQLNSMQLLLNQAPVSTVLLLLTAHFTATPPLAAVPVSMWVLSLFASLVNLSQFFIIHLAGPISGTVVGQLKTCIIVGLGWAFSTHPISFQSIVGIMLALAGMSLVPMSILRLSDDLLFLLADHLSRERDINALAQSSRRLYHPLNRFLYQQCLELGASVDGKPTANPNDRDDDRHEDVSETPLVNVAAGRGYEGVLKLLLDSGASPNESRQFPRVPLSLAIQYGHDAAVRVLLAREDTTVTLPSAPFSQQPLHFALERGSLECVLLLIERGADLQQYESTGSRALYPAISSGSHALVEFLVNRGCNPLGCCGYTALSLAAVMGHQSLVRYFLAQGVDPEIRDRTGFTALGHAAKAGHAHVVETLLEWGVRRDNVGEDGETALCWAARENHAVVVGVLLRHGADPNSPNPRGIRPIHWAVTNGSVPIFKALVARGARIDIHLEGETLLHIAARRNDRPLVEMLLQLGTEVDPRDNEGPDSFRCGGGRRPCRHEGALARQRRRHDYPRSRHMRAAAQGPLELGRRFPSTHPRRPQSNGPGHAVSPGTRRRSRSAVELRSYPALLVACERFDADNYAIAGMLLRTGRVNVHARNADRRTAIMFATGEDGDPQLVRLLLAHGANPDDQEEDGWSCLERAIGAGNEETARILVEAGANVNARDSYGQTA